jgi:hypothetical protein
MDLLMFERCVHRRESAVTSIISLTTIDDSAAYFVSCSPQGALDVSALFVACSGIVGFDERPFCGLFRHCWL